MNGWLTVNQIVDKYSVSPATAKRFAKARPCSACKLAGVWFIKDDDFAFHRQAVGDVLPVSA